MSSATSLNHRPYRVVLVGSSLFTARCLERLVVEPALMVVGVVTNPQQFSISYAPRGVSNVRYANMMSLAGAHGIPSYSMLTSMKEEMLLDCLEGWQPDAILVAGWYHMIPKSIRDLAPCLGLHASLLPKYSGGAPLVWALIEDASETGITLFVMDSGVDSGPIVGQRAVSITKSDSIATLYKRIEEKGLDLISNDLVSFLSGKILSVAQDESLRSLYPQRSPSDGWVDVTVLSSEQVYNFVRAQTRPYPGAFARLGDEWVHLWEVSIASELEKEHLPCLLPGEKITLSNGDCWLGCGTGVIRLDDVSWLDAPPFPLPLHQMGAI